MSTITRLPQQPQAKPTLASTSNPQQALNKAGEEIKQVGGALSSLVLSPVAGTLGGSLGAAAVLKFTEGAVGGVGNAFRAGGKVGAAAGFAGALAALSKEGTGSSTATGATAGAVVGAGWFAMQHGVSLPSLLVGATIGGIAGAVGGYAESKLHK